MRLYQCAICHAEVELSHLNDQLHCPDCAAFEEYLEDTIDLSVEAQLKEHGTL